MGEDTFVTVMLTGMFLHILSVMNRQAAVDAKHLWTQMSELDAPQFEFQQDSPQSNWVGGEWWRF